MRGADACLVGAAVGIATGSAAMVAAFALLTAVNVGFAPTSGKVRPGSRQDVPVGQYVADAPPTGGLLELLVG